MFRLTFPNLPDGTVVEVPGRGAMFVRDLPGPPNAPTVVLLHGWMATADLNWGFTYSPLVESYRVIAIDLHGHGRGLHSRRRFSFAACADDIAAVLDHRGVAVAIIVGYSMGGPVALEVARRHPDRTAGLVLCATASRFAANSIWRALLRPLGPLASLTRIIPDGRWRDQARRRFIARRASGKWRDWIVTELTPSDLATLLEAGAALTQFDATPWVASLDVPTAVVITENDTLVAPDAQRVLAHMVPGATRVEVSGDHVVCFNDPDVFIPALGAAITKVAQQAPHATRHDCPADRRAARNLPAASPGL